jgi:hydroxymethylbilane synthase
MDVADLTVQLPARTFTIVCRPSKLSIVQAERVARLIADHIPQTAIHLLPRASAGDKDLSKPLYAMEGRNVFTKDIDDVLFSGAADFAVHSLKDLSLERTEHPALCQAIVEREDPRDVVLFRADVVETLAQRRALRLGTSSLRRMELVPSFLQQALPATSDAPRVHILCEPMRGNVDSRLRQVLEGTFDGAVLAAAGLQRLLSSDKYHEEIQTFLRSLRLMVLPLVECPPAPGQGALLLEALHTNTDAAAVIERLRLPALEQCIAAERALLRSAGGGCHQRFGAVNLSIEGKPVLIKAGATHNDERIDGFIMDIPQHLRHKRWFAASDRMAEFFTLHPEPLPEDFTINEHAVFVSHYRAAEQSVVVRQLRHKRVWTAGTRSWFELAKRGVWVEGCADGFGFTFIHSALASPLVNIQPQSMRILTNTDSAHDWQQQGLKASGLYRLQASVSADVMNAVSSAEALFWTNIAQYQACKAWVRTGSIHACPAGRTAERFRAIGIEPVVFPSIKAFATWQQTQHDNEHL